MKCFLLSKLTAGDTNQLDPANGFCDRFCLRPDARAVFVCSDPDVPERTDFYATLAKEAFLDAGYTFSAFDVLDRRREKDAEALIGNADFILLAGGHVPTQNRFFLQIGLKSLLRHFDGVLLSISAGTMNCATTVYAMPELEGEGSDPSFVRFLPGLGLTDKMIIPHYQQIKDDVLDGLRVFADIAEPDSIGREFYVFVDGTYLEIENGIETIHGEAYLLADGKMTAI